MKHNVIYTCAVIFLGALTIGACDKKQQATESPFEETVSKRDSVSDHRQEEKEDPAERRGEVKSKETRPAVKVDKTNREKATQAEKADRVAEKEKLDQVRKDEIASILKNDTPILVDASNVVWIYETVAELPTGKRELATFVTADYRNAKDEFSREELFEKIKPIILKRIEKANKSKLVQIRFDARLSEYDFKNKGFPTDIIKTTFMPYGNRYAAQFTETKNMSQFPIPLEQAKKLRDIIANSGRNCEFLITGVLEYGQDHSLNNYMRRTIFVKPISISLTLTGNKKTKVGVFTISENKSVIEDL